MEASYWSTVIDVGCVSERKFPGMGASRNGSRKEFAKLSVSRTDTGGTVALLEVVPHLLDSSKVSNGDLDGGSEAQGNITERSLGVVVPVVSVIVTVGWLGS